MAYFQEVVAASHEEVAFLQVAVEEAFHREAEVDFQVVVRVVQSKEEALNLQVAVVSYSSRCLLSFHSYC